MSRSFKKGAQTVVTNWRGIFLGGVHSKRYHGAVRAKVIHRVAARARLAACGRAGRGADMAALTARLFAASRRQCGRSGALFFWDLREAYHRVVRQLLFTRGGASDEEVARILQALGLPPDAMQELATMIELAGASLARLGMSEQHCRVLEEAHTSTFFVYEGHGSLIETHRGGRPGDPFCGYDP